jgi:phosphoglycerate dehydrogenase-like enzyme
MSLDSPPTTSGDQLAAVSRAVMSEKARRPKALLAMSPAGLADLVFGTGWTGLHDRIELLSPGVVTDWHLVDPAALAQTEVIVSGWGCPAISAEVLELAPGLKAVVHQGGVASTQLPPGARTRIRFSNAGDANATPVAEYTLAMILLANKDAFRATRLYQGEQTAIDREERFPLSGNFRRTVGIVGASRIGRKVIALLRPFDLRILVSDPTLDPQEAELLGVELVDLDHLMASSSVVSIHAPVLPSTFEMIGASQLGLLETGATLINTSRGELVDQNSLLADLRTGRINAILDVTTPDVLPPGHELYSMPNVVLTPHIAGSMGNELARLGEHVLAELDRYRSGQEFAYAEVPVQ